MRKFFKILGLFLIGLGAAVVLGWSYFQWRYPAVGPAPVLTIERTPERIARGEYLANAVMVCMDCHSQRDWSLYAGPYRPETFGAGGERFGREMGFPGELYSKNITPHALASWTDGEIFRAITAGVNQKGQPLFPLMPYHGYGQLDREDIYAVIAYLRTIPARKGTSPKHQLDFPVNLMVQTMPHEGTFALKRPGPTTPLAERGKYLTQAANCIDCHTPINEKAELILAKAFAGGREFPLPGGTLRAPNLTPSKTSGLGNWTAEQFVQRFKMYADSSYHPAKVAPTDFNTVMPWQMYGQMTPDDLTAIFAYLQTLPAQENQVERFTKRVALR